jgi:predicted NUDIX family NTP pyrophosphohydrolase
MATQSAGILLYRRVPPSGGNAGIEVLLVHPGGPFWAKKDDGSWSIPKGVFEADEEALAAARRELEEETGHRFNGDVVPLGRFKQPSGKVIHAWAAESDWDPAELKSNTFPLEWPPKSGKMQEFPEVDRAAWLEPETAARKIIRGQAPILAALLKRLGAA